MVQEGTTRDPATGAAAQAVVEVMDSTGRLGEAGRWLSHYAGRAAAALGIAGEVRVRVVDDLAMADAHQRWRARPGTTDVLTFDYTGPVASPSPAASCQLPVASCPRPPAALDADILICIDEAARHAAHRAHPVERELLLYIVHGILHCLGHDDHDEPSAAVMHRREDEVLTRIGVGPTYRTSPDAPGESQ